MTKPVLRGLLVVAFFALSAFFLVPVFVPRPSFIPGFAPPPDMWPRTVSLVGLALGVLAVILALRPTAAAIPDEPIETDGASPGWMIARFGGLVVLFGLFFVVMHFAGFLIATMALTLGTVLMTGERGHRIWIAILAFGGPVLLLLFFHSALGTQFPKGVLTKMFGF